MLSSVESEVDGQVEWLGLCPLEDVDCMNLVDRWEKEIWAVVRSWMGWAASG